MDSVQGQGDAEFSHFKSDIGNAAQASLVSEDANSGNTNRIASSDKKEVGANKKTKRVPLSQFSRDELEARVLQLEAHNTQLRNLLAKSQGAKNGKLPSTKKSKKERPFDFTKHSKRHVLLKFAYLGWDYHGFAVQEDTQQTIEAHLFSALLKTRLIESRETSNYHRCGRTDKGVSAFDQVISVTLRSRLKAGLGLITSEDMEAPLVDGEDSEEINYVSLLNKVLPTEIRMLAWCPVTEGYSARFDCSHRTYKYFFPRGSLNIELMNGAAQNLVGYHDYRNFCKMDVGNGVVNFCRRIQAIDICDVKSDVEKTENKPPDTQIYFEKSLPEQNLPRLNERRNQIVVNSYNTEKDDGTKDRSVTPMSLESDGCDFDALKNGDSNTASQSKSCLESGTEQNSRNRNKNTSLVPSEALKMLENDRCTDSYDMCIATIEGQAFLWHQVRAIMSVLFLIGEGNEEPSIIQELLDVEKHPRKPQYCLASDVPLNLYMTAFPGIVWRWNEEALRSVISQLQALWTQHNVRSTMIRRMLCDLETLYEHHKNNDNQDEMNAFRAIQNQSETLVPGAKTKIHHPLLSRPTCESLETRVEHYVKRRRLEPDILLKVSGDAIAE